MWESYYRNHYLGVGEHAANVDTKFWRGANEHEANAWRAGTTEKLAAKGEGLGLSVMAKVV